ncbi:hypothetical protein DFJ73DRAFT_834070 [Zopfochytrium polystomum]|nr:hypothetical protein DFJ73DRAFT_834070 [Zopfochytrium polystomum]
MSPPMSPLSLGESQTDLPAPPDSPVVVVRPALHPQADLPDRGESVNSQPSFRTPFTSIASPSLNTPAVQGSALHHLQSQIHDLRQRLADAQALSAASVDRAQEMEISLVRFQTVSQTESILRMQAELDVKALQERLEREQSARLQLVHDMREMKEKSDKELSRMASEVRRSSALVRDLENQLVQAGELWAHQSRLAEQKLHNTILELQDTIEASNSDGARRTRELDTANFKLANLDLELSELKGSYAALRSENARLNEKVEILSAERHNLGDSSVTSTKRFEDKLPSCERCKMLEDALSYMRSDRDDALLRLDECETELKEYKSRYGSCLEQIASNEAKYRELVSTIERNSRELQELRESKNTLDSSLKRARNRESRPSERVSEAPTLAARGEFFLQDTEVLSGAVGTSSGASPDFQADLAAIQAALSAQGNEMAEMRLSLSRLSSMAGVDHMPSVQPVPTVDPVRAESLSRHRKQVRYAQTSSVSVTPASPPPSPPRPIAKRIVGVTALQRVLGPLVARSPSRRRPEAGSINPSSPVPIEGETFISVERPKEAEEMFPPSSSIEPSVSSTGWGASRSASSRNNAPFASPSDENKETASSAGLKPFLRVSGLRSSVADEVSNGDTGTSSPVSTMKITSRDAVKLLSRQVVELETAAAQERRRIAALQDKILEMEQKALAERDRSLQRETRRRSGDENRQFRSYLFRQRAGPDSHSQTKQ